MMPKKMFTLVLVLLPCMLLACGKKAEERMLERAIEKETGGKTKVDISKEIVHIKTEKGEMTIAGAGTAKLPDGFPNDVFVYPKASIVMSLKEEKFFSLGLQSEDDAQKVVDAYKRKMKSKGWEQKVEANMPQGTMLQYMKGGRSVMVTISRAEEKTGIQMVVDGGKE